MNTDYDLAIVGSGFGGSLLAMVARRLGLSVLLLEKGRHPRFAIGESTSPLANLLLEQLAVRYDLPRLLPLTSYGPWQRAYPEHRLRAEARLHLLPPRAGQAYRATPCRSNQLLVAASPHDEVADTHWLRADVDEFLCGRPSTPGAEYRDEVTLAAPDWHGDGTATLTGERHGQPFAVRTRLVIDATGPRGFLSRALALPEAGFADYPRDAEPLLALHRCPPVRRDAGIPAPGHAPLPRSTMPPCITSSTAAGCGYCASATASPARASPSRTRWPRS